MTKYHATLGEDDAGTMDARSALADVLFFTGQLTQAESIHGDLVARRERLLGPDHGAAESGNAVTAAVSASSFPQSSTGRFEVKDREPRRTEIADRRQVIRCGRRERVHGPSSPAEGDSRPIGRWRAAA